MTKYYEKEWDDRFFIFDSAVIPEDEFDEKLDYEGQVIFSDALTSHEIVNLLNEIRQLKQENKILKS